MSINQRTTHYGRRFGDYKFSQRSETFWGEQPRIHSQPNLTSGEERSLRRIVVTSVKVQPKMCFMHCGHVHFYHKSSLKTKHGVTMWVHNFRVSEIWLHILLVRTWTSLLRWFGQYGIAKTPLEQVGSHSRSSTFLWKCKTPEPPLSEPVLHIPLISPTTLHLDWFGNLLHGRASR